MPTERQSVTVKRRKKDGNIEFQDIVDDLPENWEGVFIEEESLPQDPWAFFDPKKCEVPPSWYWIDLKDEPSVYT